MDNFKTRRVSIQELQQQLSGLEMTLGVETNEETANIQNVQVLEAKVATCDRDISEQEVKRDRAINSVKRYAKLLRTTASTFPNPTNDEEDFLIRNLRDIGTVVLTELKKLMIKEPDLVVPIKTMMMNLGISAPSRALSRVSSRASSGRGDYSEAPSRASSRAQSIIRIGQGQIPPLPRPASNSRPINAGNASPHKVPSVTNLNGNLLIIIDSVQLPTGIKPMSRTSSVGSNKSKSGPVSAKSSMEDISSRGPVTGSARIKDTARPSSAGSVSSGKS